MGPTHAAGNPSQLRPMVAAGALVAEIWSHADPEGNIAIDVDEE